MFRLTKFVNKSPFKFLELENIIAEDIQYIRECDVLDYRLYELATQRMTFH